MTQTKTIREKIESIITYHGGEGTSGYLLSNEQIDQIEKLIEEERKIATEAAFELGYFHGKNEGKPIK